MNFDADRRSLMRPVGTTGVESGATGCAAMGNGGVPGEASVAGRDSREGGIGSIFAKGWASAADVERLKKRDADRVLVRDSEGVCAELGGMAVGVERFRKRERDFFLLPRSGISHAGVSNGHDGPWNA